MTTVGFSGIFSISNWNFSISQGNILTNNAPTSVTFVSGNSRMSGRALMNIVITSSGSITFSYNASTVDNDLFWDPFGYIINSSIVVLANSGVNKTGTLTVNVSVNDVFSFYVDTLDGFYGSSTTIVNNFIFTPSQLSPTITNFSIPTKTFGNTPFQITQPTSNSSGTFSYTSSNLSVATISGNIITIVGAGNSTITATQSATTNYTSGTITTTFQVNQSTPTNPVIIDNSNELLYFMNTSSTYGNITNSLEIDENLVALSYKVLTGNNITITKSNN